MLSLLILAWYAIASCCTVAAYGWDKRQARLNRRRVKEHTLHLLELAGGWPGGLAGQRYFRHKWKKQKYMLNFWAIVILHLAGWTAGVYLWRQS